MGYSPQPSSRYCVPPFPVRRGFIMTRRSRCVHHPALPSCSHRLRISLFSSSTRSSFPCAFEWQFSYKHGWICAQLPLSVPQFHLRRYLSNIYFRHSFIVSDPVLSRRLALLFHAFDWHLATSPAGYALSCTSRSTIHLPHISTILFSLSEIWTMPLSASTVEHHQRCCLPTNFFLFFIPATFRRPFHWYINDLYRFCAFGSSPKFC